ncbi:MAG: AEC family transporter, partial [Burkholderiales bacterium]|nr:AEC family transporter [Burkholderiales bacterium]
MAGILSVTFPFFALVLCGYLAARSRLLPLDAVPGLNMFVLYFALPCMLWRFGSSTPLAKLFNPLIALLWLAAAALIVGGTAWLARRRGGSWPDAAM